MNLLRLLLLLLTSELAGWRIIWSSMCSADALRIPEGVEHHPPRYLSY